MEDNFDVHKWNKSRYLSESDDKAKEEEKKIGDNLYKAVTGEEPKASTKNKLRDKKEIKEDTGSASDQLAGLISSAIQEVDEDLSYEDLALAVAKILKDEYGAHNYEPFITKLKSELE